MDCLGTGMVVTKIKMKESEEVIVSRSGNLLNRHKTVTKDGCSSFFGENMVGEVMND